MNIWQAIIIGGLYWLSNLEMMYSFYWSIMDPLFLSGIVGLVLGDMPPLFQAASLLMLLLL